MKPTLHRPRSGGAVHTTVHAAISAAEPRSSLRRAGANRRNTIPRGRVTGLTIIELMIALLLSFLVVAAAIGIFEANQRTLLEKQRIDNEQDALRYSTNLLTRLIRNADEVLDGSNGTSLILRTTGARGVFDCLGDEIPSSVEVDMTLSLNGQGDLFCSVDGDDAQILARSVPPAQFRYAPAPSPDANGAFQGGFGAFSSTPSIDPPTLAVRVAFTAPADRDLQLTAVLRPQVVALDAGDDD